MVSVRSGARVAFASRVPEPDGGERWLSDIRAKDCRNKILRC